MTDSNATPTLRELAESSRYPIEAFHFVRRGLEYTVHQIHEDPESLAEGERHVDGRQLCQGLRDFAVDQYGRMARLMLSRWNIHRTEDFGRIVFAMVEGGLMQATDSDTMRDFEDGFAFDQAFRVSVPVDQVAWQDNRPDAVEHGESYA